MQKNQFSSNIVYKILIFNVTYGIKFYRIIISDSYLPESMCPTKIKCAKRMMHQNNQLMKAK